MSWSLHETEAEALDAQAQERVLAGLAVAVPCPCDGCPEAHAGTPGAPLPPGPCQYPAGWTTEAVDVVPLPAHPAGPRWAVELVGRPMFPAGADDVAELAPEWLGLAPRWG